MGNASSDIAFRWAQLNVERLRTERRPGPQPVRNPLSAALAAVSRSESPIETIFSAALNFIDATRGHFVLQHEVGPYRLDVAFIDAHLGVELDGRAYHREPAQIKRDQKRSRFLAQLGWIVRRFTGSEIWTNGGACAVQVAKFYEFLKGRACRG